MDLLLRQSGNGQEIECFFNLIINPQNSVLVEGKTGPITIINKELHSQPVHQYGIPMKYCEENLLK